MLQEEKKNTFSSVVRDLFKVRRTCNGDTRERSTAAKRKTNLDFQAGHVIDCCILEGATSVQTVLLTSHLKKKKNASGCTKFLRDGGIVPSATIAAMLSFQAVHFVNCFLLVPWEHVSMPQVRLLRSLVACVQLDLIKF